MASQFEQPLDPEWLDIMRQRRMAEMLAQQGQEPIQAHGYGGVASTISPFQALGKIAQAGTSGWMNSKADEKQRMYAEKLKSDEKADMSAFMEAFRGREQQTKPYEADNAFGEDLGSLQTITQQAVAPDREKAMGVAMGSRSPMLQGAGQLLLADMLKGERPEGRTSEIKNWEFAQGLSPEERAQFLAKGGGSGLPSTVQEWEYFSKLSPEQQQQFLEMKRATQWRDMGGYQAPVLPGNRLGPAVPKTLPPQDLPEVRGAQAAEVEQAKAEVELGTDAVKKAQKADAMTTYIDEADKLLDKATGSYAGAALAKGKQVVGVSDESTQANQQLRLISGWMVSNVPRMEGPQSNYDVENYKTMAAQVGDPTVPIEDRKAALKQLRQLQQKYTTPQAEPKTERQPSSMKQPADKKKAYQEYLDAYNRAKTPEQKKMVNDRARQLGVIK